MNERRRGRPRKYDPDTALDAATTVFHARGYSAASLDDLAATMEMTRPSLYNAFGDKASLYQHALNRFITQMRETAGVKLREHASLTDALRAFYMAALDVYLADDSRPGCFVFCTAPSEAASQPAIADTMTRTINDIDALLRERFEQARANGEISADADPLAAAQLAQAVLHSIALRARSGATRKTLERFVSSAVQTLCA